MDFRWKKKQFLFLQERKPDRKGKNEKNPFDFRTAELVNRTFHRQVFHKTVENFGGKWQSDGFQKGGGKPFPRRKRRSLREKFPFIPRKKAFSTGGSIGKLRLLLKTSEKSVFPSGTESWHRLRRGFPSEFHPRPHSEMNRSEAPAPPPECWNGRWNGRGPSSCRFPTGTDPSPLGSRTWPRSGLF